MELHNRTPYPALGFESIDNLGQTFHVVAARVTYHFDDNGMLHAAEEQRPLVMADELYGSLGNSSVKEESDLSPFKPKCDVVVIGNAIAPGGVSSRRFEAGITIRRQGKIILDKRLVITGPRAWKKGLLPFSKWELTEPKPIRELPIRYEYAYGGECRVNPDDPAAEQVAEKFRLTAEQRAVHPDGVQNAPVAHSCFAGNTVGRGFVEKWYLKAKGLGQIPAPQIESVNDPIKSLEKVYAPQGLGFLTKSSAARISLAGTMDEAFIQSRKSLPENFDFGYWNGAPLDMQIPWLEGNEEVELTNIGGINRFLLPEHLLWAKVVYSDRQMAGLNFNIDTCVIDTQEKTVSLLYRLKLPIAPEIMSLQIQESRAKERAIQVKRFQTFNSQLRHYEEAHHE